jgi:predicted Fe-Mo cluster-binding NifX family protein
MKIAITAATAGSLGMMDGRFGRAPYFLIFDTGTKQWSEHENKQNAELSHGAGIQAAQTIEELGVNVLITGQVGPKALQVLRANQTKIYCVTPGKINDVLTAFLTDQLAEYFAPDEKRGE